MRGEPRLLCAPPHAVYGAAWSPDGARLAVCGGFLYGDGFLQVLDEGGTTRAALSGRPLSAALRPDDPEAGRLGVTLAALCWDDAGAALLTAVCGYKWAHHPPALFDYDGDAGLQVRGLAHPDDPDAEDVPMHHTTGCWLHRGRVVLRRRATELADALIAAPDPLTGGLHADERYTALHGARLAVIDGVAYAAKNRANVATYVGGELLPRPNPHGLVQLDLEAADAPPLLTPLPPEARVQALCRDPAGRWLYGGLADRGLLRWPVTGRGALGPAEAWPHPPGPRPGQGIQIRGVTALCCLPDGDLVSADNSGAVHRWRGMQLVGSVQLPGGYWPRSLAAHPHAPRLIVGCKSSRSGYDPGAVLELDLGDP